RTTIVSPYRHQLRPPSGKVHHLQSAGVLNQAENVIRDDLLRADDYIYWNPVLAEHAGVRGVFLGADAGDFGGGVKETVGDFTSHHIDFVVTGDSDQHVGIFNARPYQNRRMGRVAGHYADIDTIAQFAQRVFI